MKNDNIDKQLAIDFMREQRKAESPRVLIHFIWALVVLLCVALLVIWGFPHLAGKETRFFADVNLNVATSFIFGLSGVSYGLVQKGLKEKSIKRLSKQIQALEKDRNPNRDSSGLTETGRTPKES